MKKKNIKDVKKILDGEFGDYMKEELNMTDEDLDVVVDEISNERSEVSNKILDLPSNNPVVKVPSKEYIDSINESKEMYEDKKIPRTVRVDPTTGNTHIGNNLEKDISLEDSSISEILDGNINNSSEKIGNILRDSVDSDLTDANVLEVINFINKVEATKPKQLYPLLPNFIKDMINNDMPNDITIKHKEYMAVEFYEMIKRDLYMDQQFLELEEAIKKELDIPDILDIYLDHIQDIMEKDILEKADAMEKGHPDKAKVLRDMSAAFTDAYSLCTVRKKILNKKNIINKQLTKELKKYDHYCKKFNAKYKPSKYVITDIRSLLYILDRKLPDDIHIDSIKKFIILLCQIFRKKEVDNIIDHTYMYYTTRLIESLEHISSSKSQLYYEIINNITDIIKLIEE